MCFFPRSRFALGIVLIAFAGSLNATSIDAIYSFGDSLSDVGNDFILSGGAIPAPPNFQGQFSNGNIWVKDLAADLGLTSPGPSLAGGTDYAYGGAQTTPTLVPDLAQQVQMFETAHPKADPNALYTVWIGSNDLTSISPASTPVQIAMDLDNIAASIDTAISDLSSAGARNVLEVDVPNLGDTPGALAEGPGIAAELTALSSAFDKVLVLGSSPVPSLSSLAAATGTKISVLDAFTLNNAIVADPGLYGLTNATTACFTGTVVCSMPNPYLYWDASGHVTAAANVLIADAALAALRTPEPALTALVAAGLFGMFLARRRRIANR